VYAFDCSKALELAAVRLRAKVRVKRTEALRSRTHARAHLPARHRLSLRSAAKRGFDLALLRLAKAATSIPINASSGAGARNALPLILRRRNAVKARHR
jgi:hypothetical protein